MTISRIAVLIGISLFSFAAWAQKSGQSATVNLGVVQQAEQVTLQSTGGGKGALVGGTLGYASGSGKSKSKKRRNICSPCAVRFCSSNAIPK